MDVTLVPRHRCRLAADKIRQARIPAASLQPRRSTIFSPLQPFEFSIVQATSRNYWPESPVSTQSCSKMALEKRNHFLDADDSEDDVQNYNSEDELQKGGRNAKRRKTDNDRDSDEDDASDNIDSGGENEADEGKLEAPSSAKKSGPSRDSEASDEDADSEAENGDKIQLPSMAKPLFKKNLVATDAAIKKSGVIYLSRIPPFMKPHKLRSLLEPYGKINRIFLTPQDPAAHKRRVRAGGNKKKMYTEGWVEFVRKRDAKQVCELLNAQTIGGKKRSYYHDDIWTLKYLKGFKWHNLTEQIAAENAERSNRMMAEISRTTRENKEFVRNVEKGKMLDTKAKKAQKKGLDEDNTAGVSARGGTKSNEKARSFKQVPLAKRKEEPAQPSGLTSVASRIF